MMQTNEEAAQAEITTQPLRRFRWGSLGIFISALAFIVLVAALSIGIYRLLAVNGQLTQSINSVSGKLSQDQQGFSELQKTVADLQLSVQQNHDALDSQQQLINDLRAAQQGKKEQWNVTEASFLTKLANETLLVSGNVSQAIALLKSADEELSNLGDPSVAQLRKALAADILALQGLTLVDYTGLYSQLSALNEQVEKLPLIHLDSLAVTAGGTAENLAWWQRGLHQTEKVLRQLVVIRHTENSVLPFITPEQKGFLYQNLHAMLQQAMFAIVLKQADIYHTSLQQATAWLKQYFVQDSPLVSSALSNLEQLQAVNIQMDIPPLQASLQAFQNYFATQNKL